MMRCVLGQLLVELERAAPDPRAFERLTLAAEQLLEGSSGLTTGEFGLWSVRLEDAAARLFRLGERRYELEDGVFVAAHFEASLAVEELIELDTLLVGLRSGRCAPIVDMGRTVRGVRRLLAMKLSAEERDVAGRVVRRMLTAPMGDGRAELEELSRSMSLSADDRTAA